MASSWSLRRTLCDSLLRVKHPDVPLAVALRNSAGVAAPLIAGALSGHLNAGIGIAAGALNVMFSDQPGPYRQRLRAILLAALGGALSGYAGFVFGAQRDAMIALALMWGFAGGMLVLFGTAATRVGMTSMILLVIAAATPLPPAAAANAAALLFAGGLLQALLAVIAWPLQRYRPERTALAHTYREIAALARHPPPRDAPPAASDALNALQDILLGSDQAHGRAMEAFRVLLDEAERIRLELLALGELDSAPSTLDAVRAAAADVLDAIATALDNGDPPRATDPALRLLDRAQTTTPATLQPHLLMLAGALGAAARNADWAGSRGELRAASAERELPPALRGTAPLAQTYREIAALARHPPPRDAPPAASDALNVLQDILLGRDQARGRAMEAFRVLLDEAERIRLELLALGELDSTPSTLGPVRAASAQVLEAIATALDNGDPPSATDAALRLLDREQSTAPTMLQPHLLTLAGALGAAARNADWAGSRGELRAASAERELPPALRGTAPLAQLRANLNLHAVAFRHALRMAFALALGVAAERVLGLAHGYWLPMTLAIVLRADFASTLQFGLLRAVGTLLGLVLTSALLLLAPDLTAKIAMLGALCFLFRWLANANYALAVAALTGTVVILLDLDGLSPAQSLHDRAIATVLACAAALAGYLAWPTWERGRVRAAFALMLESYAVYLDALADAGDRVRRAHARAAARVARSNAQASLERLRAEPATPAALVALIERLFAHASRLIRSAMALEATLGDTGRDPHAAVAAAQVRQLAARVRDPHSTEASAWPGSGPASTGDAVRSRLHARMADALAALRHVLDEAPA